MKYRTLINRVAADVRESIMRGRGLSWEYALMDSVAERRFWRDSVADLAEECSRVVLNWDVRCIGKLRDIVPNFFPKNLRKGQLVAEYDKDGDWSVTSTR